MKNSGIEWIGEIPDSWNVVQLASLFIEHKQKNTGMQSNNLLSLSYGKIKRKDINTSDGLLPESFENYNVVDSGDIVLRLTDLQNDQRSLRTGLCFEKGIVTSAYVTLRKRNANLNSEFMHYYLHSFDVRKGFYGMGSGVRQGLNFDGIKKLAVLLPPTKIQEAIVEYLSKKLGEVDKLIEVQQAQIDKLKEYKQAIITEAVTKGLDPTVPMKDSGVEWIGMIPESWEIRRGKSIFRQRNEKGNEECLQLLSPTQRYGVIPQEIYDKISGMTAVKLNLSVDLATMKTIHKGDYCISLRSFQGGFEYSTYEGVVSPAYQVFYAFEEISDEYYKYLFKEKGFIAEMNSFTLTIRDGKNISFGDFANSAIPYPKVSEQQQIADYINDKCAKIDKLIALKQAKIEKLQEYKKSLIYEYVTGKKGVVQ